MADPRFDEINARLDALEKAVKALGKKGNEQPSSSTETVKKPAARKGTKK